MFTVRNCDRVGPVPQALEGVTVRLPLVVPVVRRIPLEPCPVNVEPAGAVQVKVTPGTFATA